MPTLVLLLVLSNLPLFLVNNPSAGLQINHDEGGVSDTARKAGRDQTEAASKDAAKMSIWPADREN